MVKKGVIGKRITSIDQTRSWDGEMKLWIIDLTRITLEDGSFIIMTPRDTEDKTAVHATHHPKAKANK